MAQTSTMHCSSVKNTQTNCCSVDVFPSPWSPAMAVMRWKSHTISSRLSDSAAVWHQQPRSHLQSHLGPCSSPSWCSSLNLSKQASPKPSRSQCFELLPCDWLIRYLCSDERLCLIKSHYLVQTFHAVSSDALRRINFANTTPLC